MLAEIFRTAGEPALAAAHCQRGYVAARQDEEIALLLLAEASFITGGLTEPLARARAMERARTIDAGTVE